MRIRCLSIIFAANFIFWSMPFYCFPSSTWTPKQVFHTQKADIIFGQSADLHELARRLGAFGPASLPQPDLSLLANKIDRMLTEVSRVLQRWPNNPVRLQIWVLQDGLQVRQQQLALRTSPPNQVVPGPRYLESYYEPRLRTIFLSLADVRLGILAHEMTHFILCESHPACPSETFQESLARYMEQRFNASQ